MVAATEREEETTIKLTVDDVMAFWFNDAQRAELTKAGIKLVNGETECPECKRRREAKAQAMREYRKTLPKAKRGRGRPRIKSA